MPIKSAQGTSDGWTQLKSRHILGDSPDILIKPFGFQVNASHLLHFCSARVAELHFFFLIFVCDFFKRNLTVSSLPNQSRQCLAYSSVPLYNSIYIGWERTKGEYLSISYTSFCFSLFWHPSFILIFPKQVQEMPLISSVKPSEATNLQRAMPIPALNVFLDLSNAFSFNLVP